MTEGVEVVKRRGRPRKTAVVSETVVVLDSSVASDTQKPTTKPRKTTSRKSEIDTFKVEPIVKKRATRKKPSDGEVEVEKSKTSRTRTIAKSSEDLTSPTPQADETIAPAPPRATAAASTILETATAFDRVRKTNFQASRARIGRQELPPEVDVEVVSIESSPLRTTEQTQLVDQHIFDRIDAQLAALSQDTRSSFIDRLDISIDRTSAQLRHSSDSVAKLKTNLQTRKAGIKSRAAELEENLDHFAAGIQSSFSEINKLQYSQRIIRITGAEQRLSDITDSLQLLKLEAQKHKQETATSRTIDTSLAGGLHSDIDLLAKEIQQITFELEQVKANPPPQIHQTQTPSATMQAFLIKQPSSAPSRSSNPLGRPSPTFSSPSSTSSAAAAAASSSTRPQSRVPPPSSPAPAPSLTEPLPLRPTQQSLSALQRDPKFRQQSRRWTSLIVGIPILIVSSVVLYKRHQETITKNLATLNRGGDDNGLPPRERGVVPGTDKPKNIGIESRGNNNVGHGVNGGV